MYSFSFCMCPPPPDTYMYMSGGLPVHIQFVKGMLRHIQLYDCHECIILLLKFFCSILYAYSRLNLFSPRLGLLKYFFVINMLLKRAASKRSDQFVTRHVTKQDIITIYYYYYYGGVCRFMVCVVCMCISVCVVVSSHFWSILVFFSLYNRGHLPKQGQSSLKIKLINFFNCLNILDIVLKNH